MRNFIYFLLPLFIFSYYDFSLRKDASLSELTEDPYSDYYFNPAILSELKERFIGFGVYGGNGKGRFIFLNFLNPNKLLPYALIFTNFETEFSSERSIAFLFCRKRKDYSYGFKFQIDEVKNFYEEFLNYEKSEFNLEREGPVGDSNGESFYFEDYYSLEGINFQQFSYYQNKNNLILFPFAFYLKFKSLDIGIDFQNSYEKVINKSENKESYLKRKEEYEYLKEGDTLLTNLEETFIKEETFNHYYKERIDTFKIWSNDISLFLRKKIKGIRERIILFSRLGYSLEISKGNFCQKDFDSSYESSLEWEKRYKKEENWQWDYSFYEEGKGDRKEIKEIIKKRKDNIYEEGGFGFYYYFPVLKVDNTIFLGIKERVDLIKKGEIYFYLGNNFEIGKFSFFPIFIPSFTIKKDTITYNYQNFFDLKLKIFDFFFGRFSYLLPGEKETSKRWVLAFYLQF